MVGLFVSCLKSGLCFDMGKTKTGYLRSIVSRLNLFRVLV